MEKDSMIRLTGEICHRSLLAQWILERTMDFSSLSIRSAYSLSPVSPRRPSRMAAMDDSELQRLYAWVDEIPLSRPKRNIARDFADGVLVAELCHHYFPRLVDLHNYPPANSMQQKLYNWNTLNRAWAPNHPPRRMPGRGAPARGAHRRWVQPLASRGSSRHTK